MFLVVPVGDITMFAAFVGAAFWMRRKKEVHKRLMLLAFLSILVAPVARLPGVLTLGPLALFGLTFLPFLAAGVLYDRASRRTVHPVYLWGGALLLLSGPGRLAISTTPAWMAFADWLMR